MQKEGRLGRHPPPPLNGQGECRQGNPVGRQAGRWGTGKGRWQVQGNGDLCRHGVEGDMANQLEGRTQGREGKGKASQGMGSGGGVAGNCRGRVMPGGGGRRGQGKPAQGWGKARSKNRWQGT